MTAQAPKSTSAADLAIERFRKQRADRILFTRNSADLTEADTRAKLIDPIFKEVLGWYEVDIRREEPAADGFADYLFGAEFPHFHVEAKRVTPRFDIAAPSKDRYLKLSGAHLLARKDLKGPLEQTAKYAFDLGTEFAVLTNGDQFIIFMTRIHGKSWREGYAIVWHGHEDIENDFSNFYNLLAADRVRAGSLIEAFATPSDITAPLFAPIESIRNADAELVRNQFWGKIAKVVGPLLTDDPTATDVQDEIIQNCYVRTPLSDEADTSIDKLLRDSVSAPLKDAGVIDLKPGMKGKTAFDHVIEEDVKGHRPGTYLLTGGVGSGKTTFLRRFERSAGAALVEHWCIWLHIDFLSLGNIGEEQLEAELTRHTYERMRLLLQSNYSDLWPSDGDQLRKLFARPLEDAKLTLLHGISPQSEAWNLRINELVHQLFADTPKLVEAILTQSARSGRRIVIVLDNTDQLGESFQRAVFLLAQRLAASCSALTIVALREEKFFAAYRRGIFDAYGDRKFHIGSPNLEDVVRKRLEYALRKYSQVVGQKAKTPADKSEVRQVEQVIKTLIRSATKRNQNIIRLLSCVSNGDMRHALGMFREFISSGNTDISKILNIVRTDGHYSVPFHEFAKSAILGARKYYRNNISHIINVFVKSAAPHASHLTAVRILARLANATAAPASHAEGFVDTNQLLAEFRQSFGRADDFLARGDELLSRGLLESEPPRAARVQVTEALRISASGLYYYKYLIRSFAYLDLVFVDTPIKDKELASRLAVLAQAPKGDFAARFERVRSFLDFLANEENEELWRSDLKDGPYSGELVGAIRTQIESELALIMEKKGLDDQGNEAED